VSNIPSTFPGKPPLPKRRPIQFSLTMLLVLMVVISLASAPAYYLMRAQEGMAGMQLIGMIVLLTGPIFLAIVLSVLLAVMGWWNRR
jgi:hypothetical protein